MIEIITKFDVGQVANLKKEERMSYEASLKKKRGWESVLSTVRRTALEIGRKEERARAEAEKL